MLNLSTYPLKPNEISLLSKGLKFIPKPLKTNEDAVHEAIAEFSRRITLTDFFNTITKKSNTDKEPKPFYPKSGWIPPYCSPETQKQLKHLEQQIKEINLKQAKSNLTKMEFQAIKSLLDNKNIIIKPADKGSSVVIMDKTDYLIEGYRQLANENHYKKIRSPVSPKASDIINNILDDLNKEKIIDKKQLEYLMVPEQPRERKFYMLPKIHKDKSKWTDGKIPPGRPIVSDCDSDTYAISEYIDYFLAPLAKKHDSYLKDTQDFLEKLNGVTPTDNCLLITLDVDSLYTNIDSTDGMKSVENAFENHPDPKRPDPQLLDLLNICLKFNDFKFNDEWFLQVGGTAMGKKFAPNYANIFLAQWEQEALSKSPQKPLSYLRYLDDIFIIWPHSKSDFDKFFKILNTHHPNIKLKSTIHDKLINFLDVTVFKGPQFHLEKKLDTKVYFKPTDTHELLHRSSYHPKHTFSGIVKSQINRFHRICNNKTDFDEACTILFSALKHRGYPSRFLRKIKSNFLHGLIPQGLSSKCKHPRCKTCPHILETSTIKSTRGGETTIIGKHNCKSERIVYAITCTNCNSVYVGQTGRKLQERFTEHRATIRNKTPCPVSDHFNNNCPDLDYLKITPLEHVPLDTERDPRDLDSPDILIRLRAVETFAEYLSLLKCEQKWIKKLNSRTPHGMNKRQDLPPPIPFCLKYMDQTPQINNIVKSCYKELQTSNATGVSAKDQLVCASKRNRNLKDMLVRA